jgi:hypothetical protein
MRTGFLAYPWDINEMGVENALDLMVKQCGANALMLNSNYHHARVFRPLAKMEKTLELNESYASFRPTSGLYEDSDLIPVQNPELASAEILGQMRTACEKRNVDFGIWALALHNSTLGEQNREKCVRNCFGDVYTYTLCPGSTAVVSYVKSLVEDLCTQYRPERLMLEGVGFLGLRHWVHHELIMIHWDEILELLFSLCFCENCKRRAEERGINPDKLQRQIQILAQDLIEQERGILPLSFRAGEVPALLFEIEDLWAYIQCGIDSVTELTENAHKVAQLFSVTLEVIPASFHRPSSTAWLERAALGRLARVADRIVTLPYFNGIDEISADLEWIRLVAPNAQITTVLNASAPTPSASSLAAQAAASKNIGSDAIYFYNLGMLTQRRLDWTAQAIAEIILNNK